MTGPDLSQRAGPSKRRGAGNQGGVLYIVATPIGNLGDMTFRAVDVLKNADIIACEDTRTTRKLLQHYGISTAVTAYHDHSDARRRAALIDRVAHGELVALVSDAGTPLISDPGYRLVEEARERGLQVAPIPGPSSVTAALSASGLPTDRFLFAGFLPAKASARRSALRDLSGIPATLVFLESPRRLPATLADMADALGPRSAVVAREITKIYEEFRPGRLNDLAEAYAGEGPPKGEVVILVSPPEDDGEEASGQDLDAALAAALDRFGNVRDAAQAVAEAHGLSRRAVYQRALAMKDNPDR